VSFSELEVAAQVARQLIEGGILPGDRIAVLDKNSIDYYQLMFGASFAGAVLVGLNYRLSAREICTVVTDAKPKILFLSLELDQLRSELDDESNAEMSIVALGADFELWLDTAPASADFPDMTSDDIVLQMYSSGTTGMPKSGMLTHGNLLFTPTMGREFYGMTCDSVNLLTSPLFHIGGTGYSLTTFGQGGHTVLVRDFVVGTVLATIEAHRVTNMFLVPAMIDMLTNESLKSWHDFSSLALIAYLGVEDHDPNGPRQHLLGSIGRSLPWNEITITDPVTGRECAEGVVGELLMRGGQTMAGYWNQPAATEQAVDAEGWLHTGDNALKDADGYIFVKDRLKDMIISGGENIYPIEVENVLMEHPSIAEVAVIGVPHAR
jgi:acyl-CoA synthetase (AMP-forming)/AMP-acid ligase II